MSGTLAFDAKMALYLLIKNAGAFSAVDVHYGYPPDPTQTGRSSVWVGEIEWDSEEEVALGALKRDEIFRIVVTFESHWDGDTQVDANNRVETMMQALEALLRVKNPLTLTNVISCGIVPQLLGEGQDTEGRGAILVTTIRVYARK